MTGDLLASSSKPENMHIFIPCNHCVHVCNDFTNSSPTQDAVLMAEEKVIINALKEPSFNVKRDFKNLLNTITLLTAEHK
jgi:Fe-S-cluster containining protein